MASDESDDEPLSVLAAAKRLNPESFEITLVKSIDASPRKKRKVPSKKPSITITLARVQKSEMVPKVIEKPTDVWLYMKDLNPTGPYSCLLCNEWFINRAKLMIHYLLNHKKDYCGICRYFVPDRQTWWEHQSFHIPWGCSQCDETFPEESEMRFHLSSVHNLVHCRLCHFRITDDDQYNGHLFQKHSVTNMDSKSMDVLWKLEYDGSPKFHCYLCSKSHLANSFFNHNMGYHHFTLRCISSIISGRDLPFQVDGADVSAQFVDSDYTSHMKCGYIETELKPLEEPEIITDNVENHSNNVLVPEIKQEIASDVEENKDGDEQDKSEKNDFLNSYKGDEDFDVTLIELIVLQTCYFDYINETLHEMETNVIPVDTRIDNSSMQLDFVTDVCCPLCKTNFNSMQMFTMHMGKMHSVRSVPVFSCRICTNNFETQQELTNHEKKEITEFDDLWICQFCDKEFDDREATRRHLHEHKDEIEYDNCFSPHLGFKCKYCPTLFWNETDRKAHQVKVHFNDHMEDFYKCKCCTNEVYSDKVWFVHHYLSKHHQEDLNIPYILKCCLCCVVLPSIDDMRSHFLAEHPEARKIFCSLGACMYKPLSQRKSFKFHVKTMHSTDSTRRENSTCVICGRDFNSVRACSTHMSQVHGPGKFKCKLCREVMHTLDERKLHYLIRHPGRHPFECNECGKSFQYKSSLYMHKQEHSPVKQSYTCSYCGKVFAKKDSFREHVQIHSGPRHACSYCPKRFVQRSNMLRHERRHTGERPYACTHCPRTFADKGACTTHTRTHTKDRSYSCLYCGQTFVQKSKLTYHIRKHTGENLETCPICSKLFTSACSLREHMKTHEKKKGPVNCPLCKREYVDQKCMIRHLKTAHTRGRFTCPVCHKAISTPSSLRGHVLTHSKVNIHRCKVCPKSYSCKRTMIKHLRRRHNLKGSTSTDYFTTLDPRQCQLGLDEATIVEIFGPPKKNKRIIADFVTIANLKLNSNQNNASNDTSNDEQDNDRSDDEGESGAEELETENQVVMELEPTDFVSVKVEPLDYIETSE